MNQPWTYKNKIYKDNKCSISVYCLEMLASESWVQWKIKTHWNIKKFLFPAMCNIVWWWGGRFYLRYMKYTIISVQACLHLLPNISFSLFLMLELLFYFTLCQYSLGLLPVSDLSSCPQKLVFIWSYGWLSGKKSTCQCRNHRRRMLDPWVRKIPWGRKWQPTPVFLPGKSYGQRNLAGCRPWGCKE